MINSVAEQPGPGGRIQQAKLKKRFKTKVKNQAVRKSEQNRIDSELNLSNICSKKSSKQCLPTHFGYYNFTIFPFYNVSYIKGFRIRAKELGDKKPTPDKKTSSCK